MAVGPYGALLESVRGVRWPARRPVQGGAPGAHPARTRGVASEFAEYRPYRQGDDPRRLDWKLLARSDRAFIRLAPDRAVLGTLIAVDASASMAFPVEHARESGVAFGRRTKWSAAKEVAVACAAVAHAGGDPVGGWIAAAGGPLRLPPRTRRGVVAEVARTLDAATPSGSASLAAAFVGAPARVMLVTDCLGALDELRRTARAHVAGGGEVHVVHVVSRAELDPPQAPMLATDPEDPATARPLTDRTRAAYRAAFDDWRADVARGWRDDGVACHEIVDDAAVDVVVRRFVALPGASGVRA
ncbi:MAG: DUF58 domain-containing protein [Gemmatimonadales bacterium]